MPAPVHPVRLPSARTFPGRWARNAWVAAALPAMAMGGLPRDELPALEPFQLVQSRDADVLRSPRPVEDPLPVLKRTLEALAVFRASQPEAPGVRGPLSARMSLQPGGAVATLGVRLPTGAVTPTPFRDLAGPPAPLPARLLVCRSTVTAPPSALLNPQPQAPSTAQTPPPFTRLIAFFPASAQPLSALLPPTGNSSGPRPFLALAAHVEPLDGGLSPLCPSFARLLAPPAPPPAVFVSATASTFLPAFPIVLGAVRLAALSWPVPAPAFAVYTNTAFRIAARESAVARDGFGVVLGSSSPRAPVPVTFFSLMPALADVAYTRRIGEVLLESIISAARNDRRYSRLPENRSELLRGLVEQPFTRQAYEVFRCLLGTVQGSDERRRATALREWVAAQHLADADTLVLYYCSLHAYESGAIDLALALADQYLASAGTSRPRARLLQAMCHAHANRFDEATRILTDASFAQASDDLAAEATFLLGWIDFQQGRTVQARATLSQLVLKYPQAPAARRAATALAQLAEEKGQ